MPRMHGASPPATPNAQKAKPPRKQLRDWQTPFLAHFAASGNVLRSAEAAGIDRGTAYAAYHADEKFREKWKLAEGDAGDVVDDVARRHMEWENPVVYEGQVVFVFVDELGNYIEDGMMWVDGDGEPLEDCFDEHGEKIPGAKRILKPGVTRVPLMERKHDAALIALLCKARNPARFRDNVKVQHTGPSGGPLEINHKKTIKHTVNTNELARELEKLALSAAHRRIPADGPGKPVDPLGDEQ